MAPVEFEHAVDAALFPIASRLVLVDDDGAQVDDFSRKRDRRKIDVDDADEVAVDVQFARPVDR